MEKPTVVIHGPQGCCKTRHAQALANAFRCDRIVDDWDCRERLRPDAFAGQPVGEDVDKQEVA